MQEVEFHKNFYRESIDAYSPEDIRSLHWNSEKSQLKRFQSLMRLGDFNHHSLLDVGCGRGDFLTFLSQKNITLKSYLGIDLMPEFIDFAQKKHPHVSFQLGDFFKTHFSSPFDFIVCNGALNLKEEDNLMLLKCMILKSLEIVKKAFGITLLKHAPFYINDPQFFHYQEKEVKSLVKSLGFSFKIYSDYVDNDFTLIVYQN